MTQQYREVKRKANVGERIRIVAAEESFGKYVNGDEFIVDRTTLYSGVEVDAVRTKCDSENNEGYIDYDEYVVLEPIADTHPIPPAEQLEALRKQQAAISAEILALEDAARRAAALKSGDIVIITKSAGSDGQYGRIERVSDLSGVLPYAVRTIPYNSLVHAYEVAAAEPAEIARFLTEAAESLSD